jgi:hypothetical protein
MTELRQFDRIAFAREDPIENRLATGSGNVAKHVVELQVHLAIIRCEAMNMRPLGLADNRI